MNQKKIVGKIVGLVGILAALLSWACASREEIKSIPETARLIDVRTPGEFAAGHHPRAENIPLSKIEVDPLVVGDKGQEIIVYCRSGRRSGIAKEILKNAGYTNVQNGGGLKEMCKASNKC